MNKIKYVNICKNIMTKGGFARYEWILPLGFSQINPCCSYQQKKPFENTVVKGEIVNTTAKQNFILLQIESMSQKPVCTRLKQQNMPC